MRLCASLLLVAALYAHAATIPVAESDKKIIDVSPDHLDKTENVSSEQELIDEANIKDVENKLRIKPEDIPVKVIVEQAETVLKTIDKNEESEEINRIVPDLRNPGLPQRQEHETQNPEYYANQQQSITKFKQSINEAQHILKQGFQGITDSIQSMLESNEPIQTIQHSIQSLREGFVAQINKINGTIQSFLEKESTVDQPGVEQTETYFHTVEKDLKVLKNDFNTGVNTLTDGVEVVAYLKAEGGTDTAASPAPVNQSPQPFQQIVNYMQGVRDEFVDRLQNLIGGGSSGTPPGVESDTQVGSTTSSPPWWQNIFLNFPSFSNSNQTQNVNVGGLASLFGQSSSTPNPITIPTAIPTSFPGGISNPLPIPTNSGQIPLFFTLINPEQLASLLSKPEQTTSKPSEGKPEEKPEAKPESKPETHSENKPEQPEHDQANTEKQASVATVTPAGPIRQFLQNNPISKGIAGAVQRIQNINNPEKPRDEENPESETKGHDHGNHHGHNSGDNNINSSGIKENEAIKEVEKLPEVQTPKEDDVKEHKTDEVVDKTE